MKNRISIEGKLPQGYVILCRGQDGEYTFLRPHLGLSVECPHCGTTAESTALAMEFYLRANDDVKPNIVTGTAPSIPNGWRQELTPSPAAHGMHNSRGAR